MVRQMRKVIVLSAVSGTGKSTYAKSLAGLHREGSVCIVSTDTYFLVDGEYRYDPTKISEAHAQCFKEFLGALWLGHALVIVDNTNLSQREISPYMLGAAALGYEAEIHTLRSRDPRIGLRNLHGVPLGEQKDQRKRLDNLQLVPWWPHREIWVD